MNGVAVGSGRSMADGFRPITRPSRVMTTIATWYGFRTGSISGSPCRSDGGMYMPASAPVFAAKASISDVTPVSTMISSYCMPSPNVRGGSSGRVGISLIQR